MATFHCTEWPECNCPAGTVSANCPGISDRRNHTVFEGKHLTAQRARDGDCRFPFTPWESFWIVVVCFVVTGWALYAANAAIGVPV